MKKIVIIPLLFLSFSLHAQQLNIYKGDFEVSGSGQFTQAQLGGEIRFGSYVMDYVQVGTALSYQDTDLLTQFSLGAYVIRLFETQTYFLPYAGSKLAFSSLDADSGLSNSGVALSLLGGVKYYFADNVSLNTEVYVSYGSEQTFIKDNMTSDSDYGLTLGISYCW